MKLTCKQCTVEFEAMSRKRKYCSVKCFHLKQSKGSIKHDNFGVKFLLHRGFYITGVLAHLRTWFIQNPYPIELRKIAYTYGSAAKKYGGIKQILAELEAEGLLEINMIETKTGIVQTLILTEFKRSTA